MESNIKNISPDIIFPNANLKNMCYIKNVISSPNIIVGDYTYYDDPEDSTKFEEKCVFFNWPEFGDKLIIGKFCSIANGVKFLMGSANHRMNSVTTYPFNVFGGLWETITPKHIFELPFKGDIVIGNDVWIGRESMIMPGVKIGNGAIIAARSLVVKDIDSYTIAGGNPAKPIKKRFDDEMIDLLEKIKWWNLEGEKLTEYLPVLVNPNLDYVKDFFRKEIDKLSL